VQIKRLVPGLRPGGGGHARESGGGGEEEGVVVETGKWCPPGTLGITCPSSFYEFRALESAFLSGSMNSEEKSLDSS